MSGKTRVLDRAARLEAKRLEKMAESAHAFVRGNTEQHYRWLGEMAPLPEGPSVWICGDCHVGNLGPIADKRGHVEVQIRDLDQTTIGNPAHDIVRLALSLSSAARSSNLPGVATWRIVENLVDGYVQGLDCLDADEPVDEPITVASVRREALGRKWHHLATERLGAVRPAIPLGKKFWALSDDERSALYAVFEDAEIAQRVMALNHKDAERSVRMIDAAYWMKGCSSLGLLRFAVLIGLKNAKGRSDYALVDLKEAVAPIAPAAAGATMPMDNAERVVAAARALSPHLGERMIPVRMMRRSLFIRELAPQDLKLEVEQFSGGQAVKASRYLAFVVGKAHARQMDQSTREEWRTLLDSDRRGAIDAPSWLWESVVSLSGSHESGYLEHCRRYALAG